MFQFETATDANDFMPYSSQLDQIDPLLNFYTMVDPTPELQNKAFEIWDQQNFQIEVDTQSRGHNALHNLEALPFRTIMENLNAPFADDIIYTAQDIADANDDQELLAFTMANMYQLGNLNTAFVTEYQYMKKIPQSKVDNYNKDMQKFVNDLSSSNEPFESLILPVTRASEALTLVKDIQETMPDALTSPLILHPFTQNVLLFFINADNINGMSVRQLNKALKNLNDIAQTVTALSIKELVSSPQVERNKADNIKGMTRHENETSRGDRIKAAKIMRVNSAKTVARLIQRTIKKFASNQKTANVTKTTKKSYNKMSRRDELLPGKTTKKIYRPNIHLYLDTSGSISIEDYKTGLIAAINIAKELKSDLLITSFSTQVTEPLLLDGVRKQTPAMLLKKALRIPVISGGTDFTMVYQMIEQRAKVAYRKHQQPEFNILISDMEYWFPSGYQVPKHARNTLHLSIGEPNGETDREFITSAYNAGIEKIDRLFANMR